MASTTLPDLKKSIIQTLIPQVQESTHSYIDSSDQPMIGSPVIIEPSPSGSPGILKPKYPKPKESTKSTQMHKLLEAYHSQQTLSPSSKKKRHEQYQTFTILPSQSDKTLPLTLAKPQMNSDVSIVLDNYPSKRKSKRPKNKRRRQSKDDVSIDIEDMQDKETEKG